MEFFELEEVYPPDKFPPPVLFSLIDTLSALPFPSEDGMHMLSLVVKGEELQYGQRVLLLRIPSSKYRWTLTEHQILSPPFHVRGNTHIVAKSSVKPLPEWFHISTFCQEYLGKSMEKTGAYSRCLKLS